MDNQRTCFLRLYEPSNKPKPPAKQNAIATSPTPTILFFLAFLVLSLPKKREAGWGGGAQRARGNEINTARRQKKIRTCRLAVLRIFNQKYQKKRRAKTDESL
jgi:hypothetical protein